MHTEVRTVYLSDLWLEPAKAPLPEQRGVLFTFTSTDTMSDTTPSRMYATVSSIFGIIPDLTKVHKLFLKCDTRPNQGTQTQT